MAFNKVIAIDTDNVRIEAARELVTKMNITNVELITVENGDELSRFGEEFSCICAIEVLEHIPHAAIIIQEFQRLMSPEGYLVFSTLLETPYYKLFKFIKTGRTTEERHMVNYKEAMSLVESNFAIIKSKTIMGLDIIELAKVRGGLP